LGMVRDTGLHAGPVAARVGLSAVVIGLYGWGVDRLWRSRPARSRAALALVLPVVAGWAVLAWESRVRANASYDAYKLLAVFYPGLLVGLLAWLAVAGRRLAAAVLMLLLAANLLVAFDFRRQMANPPLRVDRGLLELRRLEDRPEVSSLNMRIEDFWSRLWANTLLLRKPQYFPTHSYEGRLNTPLRGAWDISDSLLRSRPALAGDFIDINAQFHVTRVGSPGRVELAFDPGWHEPEGAGPNRWRWSGGPAVITILNPAAVPVVVTLTLQVRPWRSGLLQLELGAAPIGETRALDGSIQRLEYRDVVLPPGTSRLVLALDQPAGRALGGGDPRTLSLALYDLTVQAGP